TLAPAFLRASTAENVADLNDVVRHIQHAVNVAGAEAVGLGSDFDGVENLPRGLVGVQCWPRLADALTAVGFKADMVERLLGGNLLKFLRQHGSEITQ
ncbi:MAG: membrane dipeptidase, partial [Firmicutes bacterium]|nr:membrane dipeptidase [Bacillota bacterium]